jgi:PII-like signaling protein
MGDWLLQFAKDQGAIGGSLVGAAEGFGAAGQMRSTHFFELGQQPVAVTISVTEECADRLLSALAAEPIMVFYINVPMEYGRIGTAAPPAAPQQG